MKLKYHGYIRKIILTLCVICFISSSSLACTGFTASDGNNVLVGGNEDNVDSEIFVHIIPPGDGSYGKIFCFYTGFGIQHMINDQGLYWDGFWAPHLDIYEGEGKPRPYTWINEWMDTCSTVDEIIDIYNSH